MAVDNSDLNADCSSTIIELNQIQSAVTAGRYKNSYWKVVLSAIAYSQMTIHCAGGHKRIENESQPNSGREAAPKKITFRFATST